MINTNQEVRTYFKFGILSHVITNGSEKALLQIINIGMFMCFFIKGNALRKSTTHCIRQL